ncbi:hypothetical protein Gpo141_00008545 [Globisporangium polare]
MGSAYSVQYATMELVPYVTPIAAIDARSCESSGVVTLYEESHPLSTDSTFQDAATGSTRFEVRGRLLKRRKTLLDAHGVPIATFKESKTRSNNPIARVHLGGDYEGPEHFQIHAKYENNGSASLRVAFNNKISDKRCEVGFEGHWYQRDGFFWLDRGCTGVRMPVAKVYRPEGDSDAKHKSRVDIAANVDAALIAMVCGLLKTNEWRMEQCY